MKTLMTANPPGIELTFVVLGLRGPAPEPGLVIYDIVASQLNGKISLTTVVDDVNGGWESCPEMQRIV